MAQPSAKIKQPVLRQGMFFVLVGAAAALLHFCVLVVLVHYGAVRPAWANVAAFLIAFCLSFSGHYRLTFESRHYGVSVFKSLWRWFAGSVTAFAANQMLFVAGLYVFGNRCYVWVWLAVTVAVTVFTFLLGRLWAFKVPGGGI